MSYNDKAIERCIARAKRRQMIAEKRDRRIMFCGIIAAVAITAVLLAGGKSDREYTETTVMVSTGDTLWSIAEEYCPDDMDKRRYIRMIESDNACTADIRIGDVLTVRLYEEK